MNRVFLLLLCVTETLGCSSPGTDLTCGVGTVQAGDQCVAASREGGASQDAGPRDAKTVDGTSGDATSDCHHCIVAEYAVPAKLGTPTPDQLVFDAEKNLWFADGDELVRMTPGGVFTGFPIADADASGLGVNAFTVGADGALWFTENEGGFANRTVGRMTLGGSVTRFATTATAGFDEIALGPDGDFWLTENAAIAPGAPGVVARFTPAGTLTEFTLPGPRYPTGITAGPNGDVYFCEQAVYMGPGNSIGRITPSTGDLTEYAIAQVDAGGESQAFGIVTGADGNLWFTLYEGDAVGRMSPTGGDLQVFPLPIATPATQIVAGPERSLWFAGGDIAEISLAGAVTLTPTLFTTSAVAEGPDDNVWYFGLYDSPAIMPTNPTVIAFRP